MLTARSCRSAGRSRGLPPAHVIPKVRVLSAQIIADRQMAARFNIIGLLKSLAAGSRTMGADGFVLGDRWAGLD
jgi:hypothetical protein